MEICSICMDSVFLPVEMNCFSCFSENKIHCNSLIRTCRVCSCKFLQLNRNVVDRDFVKKCLYCPGVCHPKFLSLHSSFRKDFIMMKNDKTIYDCPYCRDFVGTQIEIDKHIETTCMESPIQCDCGRINPKKHVEDHQNNCPNFTTCHVCDSNVKKHELRSHFITVHNLLECFHCKNYVLKNLLSDHILFTCQERIELCKICRKELPHYEIYEHHQDHLHTLENQITVQKKKLNAMVSEYKNIQMIIQDNFLLLP